MNKKTLAIIGVITVLLIGIVSAGLLDYFGRISGSVTIEGPVFYLDGNIGGVYHKLLVNEIPKEEIEINWSDGERIVFKTELLNINEFYKAKFTIKIWMKTNNSGNTIQARIIKLNKENIEQIICEIKNPIEITATSSFSKKEFYCESNEKIDLNDYDRIGLELRGNGNESQEYWISVGKDRADGMSRVEVTAA